MTPENFVYWLNGFVEMSNSDNISSEQWKMIKDHLKLTTHKVTPQLGKSVWQEPYPLMNPDLWTIQC